MMHEASGLLEDSAAVGGGGGGGGATIAAAANLKNLEGGDGVSATAVPDGFQEEEGDRNFTGNRWPRDETLALLKIRSQMDVAFRDSTLKAPLWDEVSRKLAELGYHRSAKKCKEKFENIYKYHKRTKECRSRRQNGKNYRFFEQLEHLDNQSSLPSPSQNKIQSSTTEKSKEMGLETMADMVIKPSSVTQDVAINPRSIPNSSAELFVMSTSTSATSSSGKESQGSGKKKRKLADYFRSLMNEVLEKQENLQNKFIEALEKCERDRIAREEAWKTQELARIKREQELLAQERDIAAAKDAAVIAFLQKISEQGSPVQFPDNHPNPTPDPNPNPIPIPISIPTPISNPIPIPIPYEKTIKKQEINGVAENSTQQLSSSRWPKAEVEALITLRTNLDMQYQDNGAKGPLWEEISSSMKKLGYNRNAKRCKEKWENINKYYKRVKDSKKRRPEDSKTCPYFHILESLYEKKSKKVEFLDSSGSNLKPEHILMQMMGQQQQEGQRPESVTEEDGESENVDQNQEDDDDEEDDDDGDDYQIVVNNNPASVTNME